METKRDPILRSISSFVSNGWPKKITDDFKPYKARQNEIGIEDGCLMLGTQVIVPQSLHSSNYTVATLA